MTAATGALAPPRAPRPASAAPLTAARLMRIELRRNAMPWILPLIAAVFWFDSYRPSTAQAPFYVLRTFGSLGQGHTIYDFGPFVAGVAAWMASRDSRRGTADLLAATARPRYAAQLATWAATALWAVAAYLAFVGVMFALYAGQGVAGEPPWLWVAVGATAVAAYSTAGFAVGVFLPSRFAAPLAAFGGLIALAIPAQRGFEEGSGLWLILPTNSNSNFNTQDFGIFYHYAPDLPIARLMLLGGIAVAALGLPGLPARAGGRRLRRGAAAVTLAGVAAAGTAIGLAATARPGPHGVVIPALHDAASDQPIRYTPVCGRAAGTPVCLNPAYRSYLADVTAALPAVLGEVSGLPGAPVRVSQVAAIFYSYPSGQNVQGMTITGRPPVLWLPLGALAALPGPDGFRDQPGPMKAFTENLGLLFAHAFVGAGNGAGTPAQQAVQAALLQSMGVPIAVQPQLLSSLGVPYWAPAAGHGAAAGNGPQPARGPVYAAAQRLGSLGPAARHAWLAAHLAALRSGRLTLGQLP
jgi:hypothetical protein